MFIATRLQGLRLLVIIASAILGFLLFWAWLMMISVLRGQEVLDYERYFLYSVLLCFGFLIDFIRAARWKLTEFESERPRWAAAGMAIEQSLAVFLTLAAFTVLFKDLVISRVFLITFLPVQSLGLYFLHLHLPGWLAKRIFRGGRRQRAVIMGDADAVRQLLPWISGQIAVGIDCLGVLLPSDAMEDRVEHLRLLGSYGMLNEVIKRDRPTVLIRVGPALGFTEEVWQLRDLCDASGVRLIVAYGAGQLRTKAMSFCNSNGVHLMTFRPEPLESPINRAIKRALDVVFSSLVILLILPPVALAVWLLHRFQSPGPLIFRQLRTGLHNEDFVMYKFRTMHVDNPDPAKQASPGDPRVFRAGRWLRRSGLDELPQFINVFLGEMSIVGPRPHLAAHDEKFSSVDLRYRIRHIVKPGITGLAQVKGHRGEAELSQKVIDRTSADLEYVENWSIGLDLSIIARTALHVIRAPETAC